MDEYLNDFAIPEDLAQYTPPDIENHWAYDNLDDFVSADLLKGIKDETGTVLAYPNKSITRAEFTTLLVRALDLKQPKGTSKSFKDVKPNDWFSEPVRIASSYGIVGGFEGGLFKPNEEVKRDQIASMIVRAFESKIKFGTGTPINFTEVPNYWAKKAITDASALGIVVGKTKTTFAPSLSATRAEAVVMLYRALHQETGQQPEQVEIEKIVLNYRKQIDLNMAAQDFQKVQQTIDKYTTGFFHATNELDLQLIHHLKSKGVNTSATLNGELRAVVIDIGPRFAVVEVTGGQYTYRFEKNGLSTSETVDSDGMLYLKKTTDGTWKIYNHFVNDPENVLM
ncbi:putative S-layer protein [Schinkia azotoformans MEV2011]|uniref:Putative S-layer protein n=1 Tax=Schinkia azotoformans MEV2011 TaxID=1348973 RepID=A0A072NHF9_SCHAZ|nr:S-layer homology domain-containing protein [Schinkia azotoformans]KEF37104.1 putative S-layer protein [Schinkia azotoformans MEV2011]MEC1694326.1 S-layer homology domain-containing protein [Schinkia azotoformans]MEC1723391.1 S-layer homology domain-containing protein [Schinkia azotoformans]MEC1782019.1 S-layer homology domain-containing protein [Schinkia azotoformans]MED4329068.1 S-layer homology domain-containing protein [Schinkia azotoformans]